jgi:hypothetical protein
MLLDNFGSYFSFPFNFILLQSLPRLLPSITSFNHFSPLLPPLLPPFHSHPSFNPLLHSITSFNHLILSSSFVVEPCHRLCTDLKSGCNYLKGHDIELTRIHLPHLHPSPLVTKEDSGELFMLRKQRDLGLYQLKIYSWG